MTRNIKSKLKSILVGELSAESYQQLNKKMKISARRLTYILMNPKKMNIAEIKSLSKISGINGSDLITQYNCGIEAVTIDQATKAFAMELERA